MMPSTMQNEFNALLRADFYSFVCKAFKYLHPGTEFLPNWHIEVACTSLQDCMQGDILRLIILMPPRYLKSFITSVAYPAFLLGHHPHLRIMCVSYGQDLSDKHARDCLNIMQSDWYRKLFPRTRLSSLRQSVHEFVTTAHGYRLATSVGGVVTGRGADVIIIDDPIKPDEATSRTHLKRVIEFYAGTLLSRRDNVLTGRIIIVMHRLHEDDLVGHVQLLEPWKVLRFPAIADADESFLIRSPFGQRHIHREIGDVLHPDKEPRAEIEKARLGMGSYYFAAQYQQAPAPLDGGIIKAAWFKTYDRPELPKFDLILQSWDTASKAGELNDYSVCITMGVKGSHVYVLHVFRARLNYPELKRAVREQWQLHKPSLILIEDKNSGTQLIQDLHSEGLHAVKGCTPQGEKVMRMRAQTAMIEGGFFHLPREAAWLDEYIHELTVFDNGRFDDQVDATAQALEWINQSKNNGAAPWLEHFGRMAAEATGTTKPRYQRMMAPANWTQQSYVGKYLLSLDPDRTCMVPDDVVDTQIKNGWQKV